MTEKRSEQAHFSLRSISQLVTMVCSGRDVVLSLMLFNGWIFAMSWGGIFRAPIVEGTSALLLHGLWLASLLTCTLTLFVFLLLPSRLREVHRSGVVFATACMAASVALAALSYECGAVGGWLFFISGITSGIGTGLMSAYWGKLITRYDSSTVMQFVAVALGGASLITLIVATAPYPVGYALMALIPLPLAYTFMQAMQSSSFAIAERPSSMGKTAAEDTSSLLNASDAPEKNRAWTDMFAYWAMFLVLVVALGVSAGLLRDLTGTDVSPSQRAIAFSFASVLAAMMLLLSKMPSEGESFALFYRAIALIAGAFVVLAVVVQQAAYQSVLALSLHTIGFIYFYGLLWVFCVRYAHQDDDPVRMFVAGFFANQVGQIAGAWIGSGLQLLLEPGTFVSTAANAMIYALLFLVIALMARLSIVKPATAVPAKETPPTLASDEGMIAACAVAASRFELTPREAEILPYLVRGYDRGYIATVLVVSSETIKTHMRHIYEKLNVHTRLELFNIVSACLENGEATSGKSTKTAH